MSGLIILIIIVGTGAGALTFFVVRNLLAPKLVEGIARLLKSGKTQPAIRLARQILARNPRSSEAHYLLGEAYLAEGKSELALMEFKMVNQIGTFGGYCREIPFRKRAGELFRRFGQTDEALKEYLLLIQAEPRNAEFYLRSGELFEERGMVDKAFQYFKRAEELDGRLPGLHLRLGVILARQKKVLEAQAQIEIALKQEPENVLAHFTMGRILKSVNDYSGALRHLEKAQRDAGLKTKALIEAGTCHMSMNNLGSAVTALERATSLADGDSAGNEALYARYFLSLCCEKNRDLDRAIDLWEAIYAKNPGFRDVARKLCQYQELRVDDRIKDYLTAGSEGFKDICRKTLGVLGLTVREIEEVPNGLRINSIDAEQKWRNARPLPRLVLFLRGVEVIDESTVRTLHEAMKKDNYVRGIVLTSSSFTRKAVGFAETRPIELIDKEKLSLLLRKTKPG